MHATVLTTHVLHLLHYLMVCVSAASTTELAVQLAQWQSAKLMEQHEERELPQAGVYPDSIFATCTNGTCLRTAFVMHFLESCCVCHC